MVGLVGGLHPVVAGVAAAAGNFLSVLVVVQRRRTHRVPPRGLSVPADARPVQGRAFSSLGTR